MFENGNRNTAKSTVQRASKYFTVEPPVSDHPKCKTEWSLTGGDRLQESSHKGPLLRRGPGTSTLWKIIYCMQCLRNDMSNSMFSQKFLVYSK